MPRKTVKMMIHNNRPKPENCRGLEGSNGSLPGPKQCEYSYGCPGDADFHYCQEDIQVPESRYCVECHILTRVMSKKKQEALRAKYSAA